MADHNVYVDWETCADDGCVGVRLPTGGKCWAHAAAADLDPALKQLGEHGHVDARGVPITPELLGRLLAAAPQDDYGNAILIDARFDAATFHGDIRFDGVTFQGIAGFNWAIFHDTARFNGTTFQHDVRFDAATFHGDAQFDRTAFQHDAEFERARFRNDASFRRATFHRTQQLGPMLVRKALVLDDAVFHARIQIQVSAAALCCRRTRFLDGVLLRVRWAHIALGLADFAAPSVLTDTRPFSGLEEDRWASALERLRAPDIRGSRPRLLAVRRADLAGLTVSNVDLRACRFSGAHHLDQLRIEESEFALTPKGWRWTSRQAIAEEHHWRATHAQWFRTRIPTEHDDTTAVDDRHRQTDRNVGWYGPAHQPPAWLEALQVAPGLVAGPETPPSAAQIAALYRGLRKGREDDKDEPGAADFYYGEMEMRRHAKREEAMAERHHRHYRLWAAATTERAVLWLYWLVSGYGLRAWRALTALTVAVLLASSIFAFWGFAPVDESAIRIVAVDPQGVPVYALRPPQRQAGLHELPTAIRFSAQATTALLRGPDRPLTALGEWMDITLRLVGPALLGLSVLSIRSRIKR